MPDSLNIEPAIPVSVLVTYATCHGSTKEIAEAIAKELQDGELKVDLQPVGEVRKLDGYQAVIIGSAVHRGHWLPEALDFVNANQLALNRLPWRYLRFILQIREMMKTAARTACPIWIPSARC